MRLKIASRKSDLARYQAYRVGEALARYHPQLEIEYLFRESLGDKNQQDPLWKMPEKGVFTQDFHQDLMNGTVDLVVHSWKDLPTDMPKGTQIAATLPRADQRDLLVVPRSERAKNLNRWVILSSSPRRAYNLGGSLAELLPQAPEQITFADVRGNIPTRFRKLFSEGAQGLILAKAALDRLLSAPEPEFRSVQGELRELLSRCDWMVLPLGLNPSAAAQGALAVEVREDRTDVLSLLAPINHGPTFRAVMEERKILKSHGGGCHQKIGVSVLPIRDGSVLLLQGKTDSGQVLGSASFRSSQAPFPRAKSSNEAFPHSMEQATWFERRELRTAFVGEGKGVWITKALAVGKSCDLRGAACLWTSGLETWKALARLGHWIHGSAESLGEAIPDVEALLGESVEWFKLGHTQGEETPGLRLVSTYELVPKAQRPQVGSKTHFYWTSASSFRQALKDEPGIREAFHGTGLGHTYDLVCRELGGSDRVRAFLSFEEWKKSVFPEEAQ